MKTYKTLKGARKASQRGDTIIQIMGDSEAVYVVAPYEQNAIVCAFSKLCGPCLKRVQVPLDKEN